MLLRVGGGGGCMLQVPCMDSNGGGGRGGLFVCYKCLWTKCIKLWEQKISKYTFYN